MVATQLGGGRWRGARHSARVALCLAAAVMAVAGAVIGAGHNVWPRLFTHDAQARPCGTPQPVRCCTCSWRSRPQAAGHEQTQSR